MTHLLAQIVLLGWLLQAGYLPPTLQRAVPPLHPVRTVDPGLVLLEAEVTPGGRVGRLNVLHGSVPFTEAARRAVWQWRFEPAQDGGAAHSTVSVAVVFRPPRIYYLGEPVRRFSWPASPESPPLPVGFSPPGYPPKSVAEGVVILELRVESGGNIQQIKTVRGIPALTEQARAAVEKWEFAPARRQGEPVVGTAIVAVSFLRPVP